MSKRILLAALDPVHDNAVKLLNRRLLEAGYETFILPPDSTPEEIIGSALQHRPAAILVSRTLGYQVAEILARLVDLADAAGLREGTKLGVGGMAITREVGAELGFDASFVGELNMAELLEFIEGETSHIQAGSRQREEKIKVDLVAGFTYQYMDAGIQALLETITSQILDWAKGRTSPGVERAKIRAEMIAAGVASPDHTGSARVRRDLLDRYVALCDAEIASFYAQGTLPTGVRRLTQADTRGFSELFAVAGPSAKSLRHVGSRPSFFIQYGTGCPMMDVMHVKNCEAWGVDGAIHICPSWAARNEGLMEGLLSQEHDGTVITLENLRFVRQHMDPGSLWLVRGHRGLNNPEALVLGHAAGADLFKLNIPYGGTAGGTDPERLTVDSVYSARLSGQYGMPFDIPGNNELSGVPPHKALAGVLIMVALGLAVGAKPIPKPLFCYSPHMMIHGQMDDNMVDMNVAKLVALREIIDAPLWTGEPVAFMTQTPDRVQASVTTAAHASLASSMGVTGVTIASSDEAYSKGPISLQARIDAIRATGDMLRFLGSSQFRPTAQAEGMASQLHQGIAEVLRKVADRGDFVSSIYEGLLGDEGDGVYPGRAGRNTVTVTSQVP